MTTIDELGAKLAELEQAYRALAHSDQLTTSSIGGDDEDDDTATPISVREALDAANGAASAIPQLQDDIDEQGTALSGLASTIDETMDELDARFEVGDANLEDAREQIEEAQGLVNDAFGQRVDGLSENVATVVTAAGNALTEAQAAATAAQAAAGLAESKGETIVQVSAPTGTRATPANLWIDISLDSFGNPRNRPNRYNPDTQKWEPITDQAAIDAAAVAANAASAAASAGQAAAQAKTTADAAKTAAADASTAALNATTVANGKGRIIYQQSKPTGANASAANLWIRTSDSKPFVFDPTVGSGGDWVAVTDQAALDAAAAAVAAKAAADQAQAAADAAAVVANGRPLILFSKTTPSGTAPTGSTWFMVNTAEAVVGQWQQTGTSSSPVWTSRPITSEVIANLDVGKLTAGNAAIATLVAQKIAASTASFQTVNVSNLFVTDGATMDQATINFLFAKVVQAKKITADMIDVATLNGVTLSGVSIIGGVFKTAASGRRTEFDSSGLTFYGSDSTAPVGRIATRADGTLTIYGPGLEAVQQMSFNGDYAYAAAFRVNDLNAGSVTSNGSGTFDRLQVTGVYDASLSGVASIVVGDSGATNLAIDNNEIMVRDGKGNAASMYLNADGGNVGIGAAASVVTVAGTLNVQGNRSFTDSGWITPTLAGGTNESGRPFRYRLLNGYVSFDGAVGGISLNLRIFTLPSAYRPSTDRNAWLDRNGTASPNQWRVSILANGNIVAVGPSGGSGSLEFGGFPPYPIG